MNVNTHLMLATSISMLIAWTLYFIFSTRRETSSSIFQQFFVDILDDGFLLLRCYFIDRQDVKKYDHIILKEERPKRKFFYIYVWLMILFLLSYGRKLFFRIRSFALTIVVVWLLNRYFTDHQLDLFTVYLLVWQFVQLICHWESHKLWWPALILQQASFCLLAALIAFVKYELLFRHLPSEVHFAFLWFLSTVDIFACLHPRGHLRGEHTVAPNPLAIGCPTYPSCQYYPRDYETNGGNVCSLGLGDFLVYNLMVLFPSYPLTSMATRLWIFCGSIISIQIGNVGTVALKRFWKQNSMPGLPLPVVMFSAYSLFLSFVDTK